MKQVKFIFIATFVFAIYLTNAQVAINRDGSQADSSAILDLSSTSAGLLLPRMLLVERNLINNPAQGLIVYCTDCGMNGELQLFNGVKWTNLIGGPAESNIPSVTNPITGKIWMDRNLGATQVADSLTDPNGFGGLFQWGRLADGHEFRSSVTTSVLSNTDVPGNSDFILVASEPYDWRAPQNVNLWQGVSGTNNPCPDGFRLPTEAEWEEERASWSSNDAGGAFSSVLKLTLGGNKSYQFGTISSVGVFGNYWISNIDGGYTRYLELTASSANEYGTFRAFGLSVRCIKD